MNCICESCEHGIDLRKDWGTWHCNGSFIDAESGEDVRTLGRNIFERMWSEDKCPMATMHEWIRNPYSPKQLNLF